MNDTWYYSTDGTKQGPVDTQTIQGMVAAGQIQPQHRVWRPGMADWVQAGMMTELFGQSVPGMAMLPPAGAGAGALVAAPVGLTTYGDEYSQGLIWRDGKKLVMRKGARLPLRCVKTNEPAEKLVKRKLTWYPRVWLLLILVNLILCLIVVACVQKSETVMIGLSRETIRKRRIALAVGWLGALGSVVLFVFGAVAESGWIALLGLLVFLVAVIYSGVRSRTVSASKIDDHCVHLKGCCEAYLDAFPPLPAQAVG